MSLFPNLSFTTNVILVILLIHILILIMEKIKKLISSDTSKKSVVILVLGDIGRSPRMQRHGQSLLNNLPPNYDIHFVGFIESGIKSTLTNNKRVKLHNIQSLRVHNIFGKNKLSFIIYALLKVISEILSLFYTLVLSNKIQSPLTHIIMQNPPSIPTVIIAKYASFMRSSLFVIDWHNFGFSILALKQNRKSVFVICYRLIERYIGSTAHIHLTVTQSMKTFLIKEWNFNASDLYVLYDRATKVFLEKSLNAKDDTLLWNDIGKHFGKDYKNKSVKEAKGNDLWMVSSTSWTADEDLNMLLDERVLDSVNSQMNNDRNIVLFITGKDEGHLKQEFVEKLDKLSLERITVIPLWLESHNNYVHLLKWCDIGLCFHLSSSGLDLPMKVVDMFGVGIPVIAVDFDTAQMRKVMQISERNKDVISTALNELVMHQKNGFVFTNGNELTQYILFVYNNSKDLEKFKKCIAEFRTFKWDNEWRKVMDQTKSFQFT